MVWCGVVGGSGVVWCGVVGGGVVGGGRWDVVRGFSHFGPFNHALVHLVTLFPTSLHTTPHVPVHMFYY